MRPDLHPSIKNTRAVITTPWGSKGYRPMTVRSIESYYVDTALDNDADTWTVDFGDPRGELLELLKRDGEIRLQLFGVGQQGIDYLMTAVADDAELEDGSWTMTGRDFSSLATDSTMRPAQFRHVRAWAIVAEQAKGLGFKKTNLSRAGQVKKVQYTDGSETYWEFWYRLYRKEKMWIWTEPNGTLVAGKLNYTQHPSYYLGDWRSSDSALIKQQTIPVIGSVLRKTTQSRLWEVLVYGHRGDNGFSTVVHDPTMRGWLKKPRKVMLDTESHTIKGAQKTAWEEIFEGKVGSIEYRLTIADPGFVLRQNRIARVYLADIGLFGNFFVVGTRVQAGPDGFVQEVRLRQVNYAISRRVPSDPKLVTNEPKNAQVNSSLGAAIESSGQIPTGWGDFYVKAAKQFHGAMDYKLFLATLLAIGDQETSFANIRENGGPGGDHIAWYPFKPDDRLGVQAQLPGQPKITSIAPTRASYEQQFANEIGGPYNLSQEYGVGPMQLTSRGLKNQADDKMKAGFRNQYEGGRWHPEHNIWIAASYLHECVQGVRAVRDIDMWLAADAYNRGIQGALDYFAANNRVSPYGISIKNKVYNDPGYLTSVKSAVEAAQEAAKAARDGETDIIGGGANPAKGFSTAQQILAFFSQYNLLFPSEENKRKGIVNAALWGYYHKDEIHYTRGSERMKDFNPPPNIPGNTDCSGFATWCYKSAKVFDPNGNNYNGQGYTGTLWNHGRHISIAQARAGDLVFYRDPNSTDSHVAVFIGNGQIVSHGSESGPEIYPVNYRADLTGFATYTL